MAQGPYNPANNMPGGGPPQPPLAAGQMPRPAPLPMPQAPANAAESIRQLSQAVGNAHEVIFTATTVFPFTLFPDTVTLDREKLTIAHRMFFRIAEVMSIRVEDVLNVTADVGPFFGSVQISTRFFDARKPYSINYLWRSDALRLKRIMQGYIIALQKQIDCSALPVQTLADMLDQLGQGAPGDSES